MFSLSSVCSICHHVEWNGTNCCQICIASLLVAFGRAVPLEKRDGLTGVVQGLLGTDGFWNDFDGQSNAHARLPEPID